MKHFLLIYVIADGLCNVLVTPELVPAIRGTILFSNLQ
jgi:hypothetical protein